MDTATSRNSTIGITFDTGRNANKTRGRIDLQISPLDRYCLIGRDLRALTIRIADRDASILKVLARSSRNGGNYFLMSHEDLDSFRQIGC
jgi:hypothetical protein